MNRPPKTDPFRPSKFPPPPRATPCNCFTSADATPGRADSGRTRRLYRNLPALSARDDTAHCWGNDRADSPERLVALASLFGGSRGLYSESGLRNGLFIASAIGNFTFCRRGSADLIADSLACARRFRNAAREGRPLRLPRERLSKFAGTRIICMQKSRAEARKIRLTLCCTNKSDEGDDGRLWRCCFYKCYCVLLKKL